MVKKKRSIHETATAVIVDDVTSDEEEQVFADLCRNLAEIRKEKAVVGYIVRNATSATIDLKEPEKLVEYAILSSQVLDSNQEVSDLFELGDVQSILLEGKEIKALCMVIDENKIGIFMEKDADHADILKRVSP